MTAFFNRLKELQGPMKDAEFSRKTGVSVQTLKRYEDGSSPSIDIALKIAEAFNVSLDWLSNREGGHQKADEIAQSLTRLKPATNDTFFELPVFDVRASAGGGLPVTQEIQTGIMSFEYRWLRDLGVNPETSGIIYAQGDSMFPTIIDGAAMIVDHSQKEVLNGYIYAFNIDGDLVVKRIERLFDKTINLISDNIRYPTRNLKPKQINSLDVIGRIFYVGQRV